VDLTWKDHRLVTATRRSVAGGTTRLRYGGVTRDLTLAPGASLSWDGR
jgi:alpha-L-fucosidase 2